MESTPVAGVVIGVGIDSPGYLARCMRWMSDAACSQGQPNRLNWRSGTARSACGLGFSLLYYETDAKFHKWLKSDGVRRLMDTEKVEPPNRWLWIGDADPLLFSLADTDHQIKHLKASHVSFEHCEEAGFLARVYQGSLKPERPLRIVQHDSLALEVAATGSVGRTDHWVRYYGRSDGQAANAKAIENIVTSAASIKHKRMPRVYGHGKAPEPTRSTATGGLPIGALPGPKSKQSIACVYYVARIRGPANSVGNNRVVTAFDRLAAASVAYSDFLSDVECSLVTPFGATPLSPPRRIARSMMRYLGGWQLGVACVAMHLNDTSAAHFEQHFRSSLERFEGVDVVYANIIRSGLPWASEHERVRLPTLRGEDRPNYLAEYFRWIDQHESLTPLVSVVHYDSYAGRPQTSNRFVGAHEFVISANDPNLNKAERKVLTERWTQRHNQWLTKKR